MKRLFLIRHGKSEANVNYDILRHKEEKDIELVDEGYLDAVRAGQDLKGLLRLAKESNSDGVEDPVFVVSPWTRAFQTFQVVCTVLNVPLDPNIEQGVTEHYMNLTGPQENWEKFMAYKASNWDTEACMNVQFEGGESLADVRDRAREFIKNVNEFFKDEPCNNVVLVAHGLFIRLVLSEMDGTAPNSTVHPTNGQVIMREIK